jgi:hypothetical protein
MKESDMMRRRYRFVLLPVVGLILLGVLASLFLVGRKRKGSPTPDTSDAIIKHPVETDPNEALKYWTEEKKRKARGTNMPNVKDLNPGKKRPQHPPTSPQQS